MKYLFFTLFACLLGMATNTQAQNLILNGDFDLMATDWTTSCVNVEAYGFEPLYGGPDPTNHVAEIDDEACMHQDVCVLPGYTLTFSMTASRRITGGPATTISHLKITGLDITSTAVATYVDMDYTRTNTVFALTPVTGIPTFTVALGSGVVRVRVEFTDNTPGYATQGMIIDSLSLTYVAGPGLASTSYTTCQGVPLTLSVAGAPAGLTYLWAFGAGATPLTSTSATPSVSWSLPGTRVITGAMGNGVCADTVYDTIHVLPAVNTTFFDTTCSNVPYMFGGIARSTSGTYIDTVVTASGCDSIAQLRLYVKPLITTSITQAICNGTSYMFNGHPYTTAGTYIDTIITSRGCDSVVTLHLTVTPIPAPPVPAPTTYCQNDAALPLAATGTALTWYTAGGTTGTSAPPIVNTTVPGYDTFYVTQTVNFCTSDSAIDIVVVKFNPNPPHAKDTGYCQFFANPVQLSAIGSDLKWYTTPFGGTPLGAAPVPSTSTIGVTAWFVSQTVNGCEGGRIRVTVNVREEPVFSISADRTRICQGDTIGLHSNTSDIITLYSWTLADGDTAIHHYLNVPELSVKFGKTGYQNVYLKVTGTDTVCSAIDTMQLYVITSPEVDAATKNEVCLGDTVALAINNHSANADSFFWTVDNTPLLQSGDITMVTRNSASGGPYQFTWNTAGLHTISVFTKTSEGCRSPLTFDSILVNNKPDASFAVDARSPLCLKDSVFFSAKETGYDYSYVWSPASFFNNVNKSSAWGTMDRDRSIVTLTVTDPFGCAATTSQELDPGTCCQVVLPSAFTPNGDQYNNYFRPIAAGYHNFHRFVVTNRWGVVVFESGNNNVAWDGNYNGVPQDMGVYYYILTYDCGGTTITQKGDVTLIR